MFVKIYLAFLPIFLHYLSPLVLLIQIILRGFYFHETSRMRSFVKINSSQNDEITLPFTDVGKSCSSPDF